MTDMDLDDCQWVNCFLESPCHLQPVDFNRVEEGQQTEYSEAFLQELAPLKDGSEEEEELLEEEESKVVIQELAPLQPLEDEEVNTELLAADPLADHTEKHCPVLPRSAALIDDIKEEKELKPVITPVLSLDRLKSRLASQLKACLSRVPPAASTAESTNEKSLPERNRSSTEKDGLLKCDHCGSYFTKSALAAHLHSEICHSSLVCTRCSRKFSSKAQFMLHLCINDTSDQQQGIGEEGKKKRYQCHVCSKTFLRYPYLINHAKIHAPQNVIRCTICYKQFENNRKLINHLMSHNETSVDEKPSVESLKLSIKEKTEEIYIKHEPIIEDEIIDADENIKDKCPAKIPSEDKIKVREKRSATNSHKLRSEDKSFKAQPGPSAKKLNKNCLLSRMSAKLNGHLKKHKPAKQTHACKKCKKSFESFHSLKLHMKTHMLACTVCSKTFDDENKLAMHVKCHKSRFECSDCKEVFDSNAALRAHARSHKLQCELCKRKSSKHFASTQQLLEHMQAVHSGRQTRSSNRIRAK